MCCRLFRGDSTDGDAVVEVLGEPGAYDFAARFDAADARFFGAGRAYPTFSTRGRVVLDGGAHVGAFTRLALREGATRVLAFEPEPENAAWFRRNTQHCDASAVELRECCLVGPSFAAGAATLVLGKQRKSDGAQNTWRHALETYNSYADDGKLERATVQTTGFFDALQDDVSYVKLDIEGAELDILAHDDPKAWRNVERLVFEYSFTKRRELKHFRTVLKALENAGFACFYDFKDTLDQADVWDHHTDALVFCARDL